MEGEKSKVLVWVLIAILIFGWFKHDRLKDENERLEELIDEYNWALIEANENIEEANSAIENAQWYAWSSYEDMGLALDDLHIVDTVSAP